MEPHLHRNIDPIDQAHRILELISVDSNARCDRDEERTDLIAIAANEECARLRELLKLALPNDIFLAEVRYSVDRLTREEKKFSESSVFRLRFAAVTDAFEIVQQRDAHSAITMEQSGF